MKSISLTAACALFAVGALAQGTVNFANRVTTATPPLDQPVYVDAMGGAKAGPEYVAQLFAGAAGGSLSAVGSPAAFRSGTGVGYWVGVPALTIPGIAGGSVATIVVKAWEAKYATYDAAVAGGSKVGASDPFEVTLGGAGVPPTLPSALAGFKSFAIIPEPSTMALGLLGAAVLLFRRRN
jgi:hypothetical protein